MSEEQKKVVIEVEEDQFVKAADIETFRVLSFYLKEELYAIDIADAKEVVRPTMITRVPNVPEFVLGIMNLRGEIVPVLDIRSFFGLDQAKKTDEKRIILTDMLGTLLGICVDKVSGTYDIPVDDLQPPLATLKGDVAQFTRGQAQMGDDILILLHLEKILSCEKLEALRKKL